MANDLKESEETLDIVLNIMSSVVKTQDEAILFLNLIKKNPEKSTKLNNHSIYALAITE